MSTAQLRLYEIRCLDHSPLAGAPATRTSSPHERDWR